MVFEACCNRDRTQAVFPDPVIPAIMEVKGCSNRNRWHFCENGTVWNGVRPTLWCLDITCLCMLSFLLNDFWQTEQNQLMSAPQEQNVDWENASIRRIDIVLKAIKFNSSPSTSTTATTFLLFSFFLLLLLLLLLISIVFPPPPHFNCFSSSYSSSFLLLFLLLLLLLLHDIIDKPVKLDILNEIPPQVNEMPQHFIHEIKTIAYDVT